MDLPPTPLARERVEAFQRRHRVGVLTLLFTDLVGSTRLKQELGDTPAMLLLREHDAALREVLSPFAEAEEIATAGDSFFVVFTKPSDAARFALLWQARLRAWNRGLPAPVLERVGIHVGEVFIQEHQAEGRAKDLFGLQIDTASRVMSLAQGGQILLSRFAFDNARQALKGSDLERAGPLSWLNHGAHALKGVDDPVEICEVGQTGEAPLQAPADSEKAHRTAAQGEPVLGWRPALEQAVPGTEWVLERKLGEGGFGEVWLGQHRKLKERAVFKFCFRADRARSLKRELTLFRLLKERAGAHPNIVAVRDVYLDAPPYYLVTDFAAGQPLRAWCDALGGAGAVPLAAKLEIVAQVADALQAAHAAGVIHRDVKPSNILVEGGPDADTVRVKLTDFGIGQVLSQEALAGLTRLGFTETMMPSGSTAAGTQIYLAPELLTGQPASPRSDLYALGVVLYQLLAGDLLRPLTQDWGRRVGEPLLREDLDQCFAGDPQERYASTAQLAASLRRFDERRLAQARAADEQAARERAAYRRGVLRTGAVAAGIVLLIAALALYATSQATQARREKDRADANRAQAEANFAKAREAVDQYLSRVTDNPRLKAADFYALRRSLLETAVPFYESFVQQKGDDPKLEAEQARVLMKLSLVYETMGDLSKAEEANRRALAIREKLAAHFPTVPDYREELSANQNNLAILLADRGEAAEAEAMHRRALENKEKLTTDFPTVPEYRRDLANSHNNLALVLRQRGQVVEAEAEHRRALALKEKLAGDFPHVTSYRRDLGNSFSNLGILLAGQSRPVESEAAFRRALAIRERLAADFPADPAFREELATTISNLGPALRSHGKVAEEEAAYRRALEIQEKLVADFPAVPAYRQKLANTHNNLGNALNAGNQPTEAEAAYRRALKIQERLATDFPKVPDYRQKLARSHFHLGNVFDSRRATDAAAAAYRQALAIQTTLVADFPSVPEYRHDLGASYNNLGELLRLHDKTDEASAELRRALAVREKLAADFPATPDYQSALGATLNNLAAVLDETKQPKEARGLYERAIVHQRNALGADPKNATVRKFLRTHLWNLSDTCANLGDHAAARAHALELPKLYPAGSEEFYRAAGLVARCVPLAQNDAALDSDQRHKTAETYAREAVELLRQAIAKGYKDAAKLPTQKQFAALRDRPDFQALARAETPAPKAGNK